VVCSLTSLQTGSRAAVRYFDYAVFTLLSAPKNDPCAVSAAGSGQPIYVAHVELQDIKRLKMLSGLLCGGYNVYLSGHSQ
jgi:hypothetical protein